MRSNCFGTVFVLLFSMVSAAYIICGYCDGNCVGRAVCRNYPENICLTIYNHCTGSFMFYGRFSSFGSVYRAVIYSSSTCTGIPWYTFEVSCGNCIVPLNAYVPCTPTSLPTSLPTYWIPMPPTSPEPYSFPWWAGLLIFGIVLLSLAGISIIIYRKNHRRFRNTNYTVSCRCNTKIRWLIALLFFTVLGIGIAIFGILFNCLCIARWNDSLGLKKASSMIQIIVQPLFLIITIVALILEHRSIMPKVHRPLWIILSVLSSIGAVAYLLDYVAFFILLNNSVYHKRLIIILNITVAGIMTVIDTVATIVTSIIVHKIHPHMDEETLLNTHKADTS